MKGYEVHGVVRRASTINTSRIDHLYQDRKIQLYYGDITDSDSIRGLLQKVKPHEIYNLAAQSHVKVSFEVPIATVEATGMGALKLLNAVRDLDPTCRVYQASSTEMFGSALAPQRETTPFHPRSPYGCAKVFAYHAAINYREAYGMHVSNGILSNHTSHRRGEVLILLRSMFAMTSYAGCLRWKRFQTCFSGCSDSVRAVKKSPVPELCQLSSVYGYRDRCAIRLASDAAPRAV